MSTLKLGLIIANSFACGWFTLSAVIAAAERIYSWKQAACWALSAAVGVASVIIFYP